MAGASKKRAVKEQNNSGSSQEARNANASSDSRPSPLAGAQRPSPEAVARFDGPREATPAGVPPPTTFDVRNISEAIGMAGWALARGFDVPNALPKRPANVNNNGREVIVKLNSFPVMSMPNNQVHQYDVVVNRGGEKRGLVKKVWESKAVQAKLKGWLFDGNKLAWSSQMHDNMLEIPVDLDAEEGRKPGRKPNTHRVFIKRTKALRFESLQHYMSGNGNATFDEKCLEAINFLDHLMREYPSQRYTTIKRSFYPPAQSALGRLQLGGGIEAFKGVYSSMRIVNKPESLKLAVNVDVANGTFWTAQKLTEAVCQALKYRGPPDLQAAFSRAKNNWDGSPLRRELKRFGRVTVIAKHRQGQEDSYVIDKFIHKDALEHKFEVITRDSAGETKRGVWITMKDYFLKTYNVTLTPGLPVVKMTRKDIYMPMEALWIPPNQRYSFKLDEKQTSSMIKFAVTLPKERWGAVENGVNMLKWAADPYLNAFNVKISNQPTKVKGRILPAPSVKFAKSSIAPNQTAQGRWRIDGCQFYRPNSAPLKSWGICLVQGRGGCDQASAQTFISNMVRIYEQHGGHVDPAGKQPAMCPGSLARGGEMITDAWNATGNKFKITPQLLVFIVPDRNSETYARIKKSCECRYGIPSQVMQASHVMKNQPQYISNVLMKINAKLGGATSLAMGNIMQKVAGKNFGKATMCIGADVSHPAPGSLGGSYAALTMSLDLQCTRYAAQVNTNGHRVEIITTANIDQHLGYMFNWWVQNVGRGRVPERVLYFRDGVSEGQYAHVLEQEVRDMKMVFKRVAPKYDVPVTVMVASKRHHVRFFPEGVGADRNGNPHPGTLVETGITHPFEFDFYLNAHSAIKGTARPVHYHVLLNEANVGSEEMQQFIFEHSFQYARSTTPVSLFPAVYYAHLASQRARAHENKDAASSGKKEDQGKRPSGTTTTSDKTPTEVPPLIPINNSKGLAIGMWYI